MFSSNEKISGRQAFRLLVFDLLGLGTLLIPAAVAGFCGGTAFSALLWEQCLDFYFYAFWCMQWGICRAALQNIRKKCAGHFSERPYRRDIFCI